MKNLFSREVKKTFYNIGRIGKSNGTKFRILHKPATPLADLQDMFYAMHKSILKWRMAVTTYGKISNRAYRTFRTLPIVPAVLTKNMGIRTKPLEYIRQTFPRDKICTAHLNESNYSEIPNIAFSSRVPLDLLWTKNIDDSSHAGKAQAAHAKLSLCETGAVLNIFHKGVVGGLPGRHIREIISAAYEKGAIYKTDIVGFFRNTNKLVVKNALLHAGRKQHLVMLAEAMFSRGESSEFIPMIKSFTSDSVQLADDFWSDSVQTSGHWPSGVATAFPLPGTQTAPLVQDILALQDSRIAAYKRAQISSSGANFKNTYGLVATQSGRQHLLHTTTAGQLSIAGFCSKLADAIRFANLENDISAKAILYSLLKTVAAKRDGIVSVDAVMAGITLPEDIPSAMMTIIKSVVTDILTHYVNSIVIPVTSAMFMFKIKNGNSFGPVAKSNEQVSIVASHRERHTLPLAVELPTRMKLASSGSKTIRFTNNGSSIVPPTAVPAPLTPVQLSAFTGNASATHGTVSLFINNELLGNPEDLFATAELHPSVAIDCNSATSRLYSEPEDSPLETGYNGVNGLRFMSELPEKLEAIKRSIQADPTFQFAVTNNGRHSFARFLFAARSQDGKFIGAAVKKVKSMTLPGLQNAFNSDRTDDRMLLTGSSPETENPAPGFVITTGKNVPLHLLNIEDMPGQDYEYRGRQKHTKYVKGNMCVISDSPIRKAPLGEYLAHIEWQLQTLCDGDTVANNFMSLAVDKFVPDSILNADVSKLLIRVGTKIPAPLATSFKDMQDMPVSKEQAALSLTPKFLKSERIIMIAGNGGLDATNITLMPRGVGDMLLMATAIIEGHSSDKLSRLAELQTSLNYFVSYDNLLKKAVLGAMPNLDARSSLRLVDSAGTYQTSLEFKFTQFTQQSDYEINGLPIKAISSPPINAGEKIAVPCGNNLLVFTLSDAHVASNVIDLLDLYLAGNYEVINCDRQNRAAEKTSELVNLACDYALDYYVTANNALPEGALTSPLLANYVLSEVLDDINDDIAKLGGEIYAYMDDISVMFKDKQPRSTMFAVNKIIGNALAKRGLRINKPKTNMIRGQFKREIFGVCVLKYNGPKPNIDVRLTRTNRRKLRSRVHNMKKFLQAYLANLQATRSLVPSPEFIAQNYPKGFNEQSHLRIPRMLNKLGGSLAWAMAISQGNHSALRDMFKTDCLTFFRSKVAPVVRECSAGLVDLDVRGKAKLDEIDEFIHGGAL